MAKYFQVVNMEAKYNQAMRRTGLYQEIGVNTAVAAGAFVVPTGLADNTVYGSGIKDINKMTVEAPVTAATAKGVYVTDIVKVSSGSISGNEYRIGAKTIGLIAAPGEPCAINKIELYDEFQIGADNFNAPVGLNTYATLTDGSVDLTPAVGIPATGLTLQIMQELKITEGTDATTTAYLCMVVQL